MLKNLYPIQALLHKYEHLQKNLKGMAKEGTSEHPSTTIILVWDILRYS